MSLITDTKYINLVSPELRNFKWKKESLANCSCPICGDSQKDSKKARGYFYQKHGRFFYKCHNCSYWSNLYKFLSSVSPALCKEYSLENIRESGNTRGSKKTTKDSENTANMLRKVSKKPFQTSNPRDTHKVLSSLQRLDSLPTSHHAVQFANIRMIPKQHWKILYFTEDFGSFMRDMDPESLSTGKEPRLVIPFFNSHGDVVAAQGRAINLSDENNARRTVKYMTVKKDKSIDRLWYGLWRCNPNKRVYVVEGPIDSLFLNNAIAMVGAGAISDIPSRIIDSDVVFVLDNEPRNKQIVQYNESLVQKGRKVCIWPEGTVEKDINDMAHSISTRRIRKIIDENTFSGLEAKVRLREWKRT